MSDITCAWDAEPWEVYGLRHEGWSYITLAQAAELDLFKVFEEAQAGNEASQRVVNNAVYRAVLSGKGCPECGFDHGDGPGPYRETQLHELVFDGVTDDDPAEFM